MIVSLLKKIVSRLPFRTIETDGDKYLTRWYVFPGAPRTGDGDEVTPKSPVAMFIHYFHRSDADRHQHSHPWRWSIAVVLAGGYTEYRGDRKRVFRPGSVNVIRDSDFHRVELLDPKNGSWSLFIAGPGAKEWGFFVPWREYLGGSNTLSKDVS